MSPNPARRPDGRTTGTRHPPFRTEAADQDRATLRRAPPGSNLAEISAPDFPGEQLIACRNPVLAADRARRREDLLAATEKLLDPIIARVTAGRLAGAAKIGVEAGKVINKYKTGKHLEAPSPTPGSALSAGRRRSTPKPPRRAVGDPHPRPRRQLDAPAVAASYKNLSRVERDFCSIKSDDLDLRPAFRRSKNTSKPTC